MDTIDSLRWLQGEADEIITLYLAGQRGKAFENFSALVAKGRFRNLGLEEREAAFLKPLESFAAKWEEKEGLVIAGRIRAWRKDYLGAKDKFTLAIVIDPEYAAAYNFRGSAFTNLGDQQGALMDIDKAIAIDPESNLAYINRGITYFKLGENQKAFQDFEKAIALDPENSMAFFFRGNTHSELGDKQKALLDYDKAITFDPEDAASYNNRGTVHSSLGEKKKALLDYDKAIELDPKNARIYSNRGNTHSALGDMEKAISDYDRAIELDPLFGNSHYGRSKILEGQEKFGEAINDLEKFLELGTNPFLIERAKARLVDLQAKLKDKSVGEISALVDMIREALRFEGDQITHFTSLTGARYTMLEKSPFRISEASFMNDPSEGKALFDLHKLPKSFDVNAERKDGEYIKKPFFGCFVKSEMKDDLGMWRLYGQDATGASITFDRRKLLGALMKNEKLKNLDPEALAGRAIFDFFQIAYFDEKGKVVLPGKSREQVRALQG